METSTAPDIHFKRITAQDVLPVCELTHSLSPEQRLMVTDNAISMAQASFSKHAWMRAIYADNELIGFILLHIGSDYDDGIDCPGVFLWRFMIAHPYQSKGYGRLAMERLFAHLRSQGVPELFTCCGLGKASPEGFYLQFGFTRTGEMYGDEVELRLKLN